MVAGHHRRRRNQRSLNLNVIAALQADRPFILLQPLAFLIFFTAMLSELHRAPFDIPVAESEIVGGYFVEYSGIRWSHVPAQRIRRHVGLQHLRQRPLPRRLGIPLRRGMGLGLAARADAREEPALHPRHHVGPRHGSAPAHRPAHELLLEDPPAHEPPAVHHERLHPRLRLADLDAEPYQRSRGYRPHRLHHLPRDESAAHRPTWSAPTARPWRRCDKENNR